MVKITEVIRGSYAEKCGIHVGDSLISINGTRIRDVLDYRFYMCEKHLEVLVDREGEEISFKIKKGEYDDIGLDFETYLMDNKRTCCNKCVFCFIDQMPKGYRDTLYFKDDDSRLSFLMGNYVTLTNFTDADVDRIIKMHMSPINISVHTTDPELRVKMLNNKRAGDVLKYLDKFNEAGIKMNCQIVLCKGYNDGEHLTKTMHDLASMYPQVSSVSIVPCGITKYRDGLPHMELFTKEESAAVVRQVETFAQQCKDYYGEYIFLCADELYLEGGLNIPSGDYYGEYSQIENGVGMIASMKDEFDDAIIDAEYDGGNKTVSVATGALAYDFIKSLADQISNKFPSIKINVYKIENDFFGRTVTVAGLVTAVDMIKQLKGKELGETLYIPSVMLRSERDLFLCGTSIDELSKELGVDICITETDGYDFLDKILGGE
ncbi:MAG: DUF512 domain-containing protein [Clostridia bacterium]|nr:DUF512 domain-containing protein [Clostridia bacterium]